MEVLLSSKEIISLIIEHPVIGIFIFIVFIVFNLISFMGGYRIGINKKEKKQYQKAGHHSELNQNQNIINNYYNNK